MQEGSSGVSSGKVILGRITGIFGVQGWIKVHSDTSPRENITTYKRWWLKQCGDWFEVTITGGRPQGKTIIAQIQGVSTPEQARELIGSIVAVNRSSMPALKDGEYYWADLTGMNVQTVDGTHLGSVLRLFETGANDVVVVSDERSGSAEQAREILVPWVVPDVVTEVDQDNRLITIDWDPDF